jgi:hypothetical protein
MREVLTEPALLVLLGAGLVGCAAYLRRAMRRLGSRWEFDED